MTVPQWRRWKPRCTIDGEEVRLGHKQAELLATFLVHHPEKALPVGLLISSLWEPDREPPSAAETIRVMIDNLRRKGIAIRSEYNFGWRIPLEHRAMIRPFCRQPWTCKALTHRRDHCHPCAMFLSWQTRLNSLQLKVLKAISADPLESYASIAERLGLEHQAVLTAARSLRHKGLAPTRSERMMLRKDRLLSIIRPGPMTQKEMARWLNVSTPTLQTMLLEMEAAGAIHYPHSKHRSIRPRDPTQDFAVNPD
jgi:DNA-binding MarR family transcriptional regulator